MFIRIFEIVFPVLAIVLAGVVYGKWQRPRPEQANRIILHVFLPCLIFTVFIAQPFNALVNVPLLAAAFLMHLVPALLGYPLIRIAGWQTKTVWPPVIFANAGNLGLPLFALAFGEPSLAAAVILFLTMNILQFTVGVRMLDHTVRWHRALLQPVMIAALLALLVQVLDITLHQTVLLPLEMMGQVAVPLMLFTLGISLASGGAEEWMTGVIAGLMIPVVGVLSALLVVWLLPLDDMHTRIIILYGALPPAVLTYIFAQRYNQEPGKVASIVMIGNMMALFTIPLTLYFILPV